METQKNSLDIASSTNGPRLRLIARLDVKLPYLVKGVQLEGLRKLGDPSEFARRYFMEGADELFLDDVVASLHGRNGLFDVISEITKDVFVPITVGGGLRSSNDVELALRHGADKVAINSGAVERPKLISEIARNFGSQCVVISIQAKWSERLNTWEVMTESGREPSGIPVENWAKTAQDNGAGELIVGSVDRDGTRKGFDLALVSKVNEAVSIPVIAAGGFGRLEHLRDLIECTNVSGLAIGTALHFRECELANIKSLIGSLRLDTENYREEN